jgi:hypothetical protein
MVYLMAYAAAKHEKRLAAEARKAAKAKAARKEK